MYSNDAVDNLIRSYCSVQQSPQSPAIPFLSKECISPLRWREARMSTREKALFVWSSEELAHLQTCSGCMKIKSFMEIDDGKITELSDDIPANSSAMPPVVIWALAASILIAGTIFAWLFFGQVKPDQGILPSDLALQSRWDATGGVLGTPKDERQFQPLFKAPPGTWYMAAIELIDNEVLIRPSTNEGCEPLESTGGEIVFPETFVRPTKGEKVVYLILSKKPIVSVLKQLVADGTLKLPSATPTDLAQIISNRLIGSEIELASVGQLTLSSSEK